MKYPNFILICVILGLTGCQLPQWRVFEAKVPEPIVKGDAAIEVDRQAADYIARKIEQPPELKPVAVKLSQSLGEPRHPINDEPAEASAALIASFNKQLVKTQEQIDELNKRLEANRGKPIEGTGYNIFGMSMGLGVIGLIALVIIFPPIATVLWWLMRRSGNALANTVRAIRNYVKEHPESGTQLKSYLSSAQDAADKAFISKIKARL